ncbi:hypothetical protein EJC49_05490 [Aquibium carbonis]|uniref:Uncharacterized protein n=1 Tax=Aquibium carbonis TaxID=2495581 RepID=A0A429Z148_9HYPH|nr:hypothetical protein [Aquibium carbonis]RST87429.1 hypothetical protein EJC49_05490 [Aquibium carbonis]
MATYTWEYGGAGTGLHFTIVYDIDAGTFTVNSLEGKFDLNALWWDDGENDGSGVKLSKTDNSLNMNGSDSDDWDGMAKLSSAGLGKEGENKSSFISEGETATFSLADFGITGDFDVANGGTLGVRATSVNGGDSIKLVDKEPVYTPDEVSPPADDHFPEWDSPSISHVTFYFETGTDPYYAGDDSGIVGSKGANDPDGWYTVKFDVDTEVSNDLDDWVNDALALIYADNPDLDQTTLAGVSIKGGTTEIWYDFDNDPNDVDTPPSVWIVEKQEVDDTYSTADLPIA